MPSWPWMPHGALIVRKRKIWLTKRQGRSESRPWLRQRGRPGRPLTISMGKTGKTMENPWFHQRPRFKTHPDVYSIWGCARCFSMGMILTIIQYGARFDSVSRPCPCLVRKKAIYWSWWFGSSAGAFGSWSGWWNNGFVWKCWVYSQWNSHFS